MPPLVALPVLLILLAVFLVGTWLGALANWAIYRLAWNPRDISPWGPKPIDAPPRTWQDRIPVLGWFTLMRETPSHGRGFGIRPMLLELALGVGLAWLYWWEVEQRGLIVGQLLEQFQQADLAPIAFSTAVIPRVACWSIFLSHALLITLMVAASFIDIDEKIIPDEITVPGTLLGLVLAACWPLSLLPVATFPLVPPEVGIKFSIPQLAAGLTAYIEPTTLSAPQSWPASLAPAPHWQSLAVGQACWWVWCFALTPRIWRGRRGAWIATKVIARRVIRELLRPPLRAIAWLGAFAIAGVWWWGHASWIGLLTALVGLAASGGLVWVVRIVGSAALQREAMGFGDVTLMMMIGTFIGWQAAVIVFFLSPFAGLVVGAIQAFTKRDDVIPYGPFLCLGTLVVIVCWARVWSRVQFAFELGWLVPGVLFVCFVLLGVMLFLWQQIKTLLFGSTDYENPAGEQ